MMSFAYFLYADYDMFPSQKPGVGGASFTWPDAYNGAVIAEIGRAGINAMPADSRRRVRAWPEHGVRPCGSICCRRPSREVAG